MKPPPPRSEPSPKIVFISMPGSMYMKEPASAMHASPGSSVISTNCISSPTITKSISSATPPGGLGIGVPKAAANRGSLTTGAQLPMPSR